MIFTCHVQCEVLAKQRYKNNYGICQDFFICFHWRYKSIIPVVMKAYEFQFWIYSIKTCMHVNGKKQQQTTMDLLIECSSFGIQTRCSPYSF